jgi:hypothetical protein
MRKIRSVHVELEELSNNLDEIYIMISEQGDKLNLLHTHTKKEDTFKCVITKHIITLSKHIERLIHEKEVLMKQLQLNNIPILTKD